MDIASTLVQLGFTQKEATVYIVTLELGMAPASVIAKKAKMKRTTVHEILKKLGERGLAEFFMRKNTRFFSVLSPRSLLEKYETHIRELQGHLPQLLAVENRIVRKPKVSFYEGKEDLRRLYLDPLTSKTEILNYFHPEKLFEYFSEEWVRREVIRERVKRGRSVRVLMPDSPIARQFQARGAHELRNARIAKGIRLLLPNEIYIYDNKYSIFSFDDDMALVIESEDVATTQRAIFELAWESAHVR
ncbi:MAG: helix-turn-helix domain-containing protein [Candidatus Pacebacteria bacterium]|nr:helix-turn-helix domain-containing protein [Candidatus Paceibacterota bacterium]